MRASFTRSTQVSPLVRQLSESSGLGAAAPAGQDFAERLGAWLSVADAITLRTALQTIPAAQPGKSLTAAPIAPTVLAEELHRVRATLTKSITTVENALPLRNRADHSAHGAIAAPSIPLDPAAEFAMLQQRYGEQQRRMEMSADALRARARELLSQASPDLARLAALDEVMDKMLGGREQHALSTVPVFLKKRFEQLRREAAAEAETLFGETPNPSQQLTWLVQLAAEFQQALLAELDVRLLPIAGMAEALQSGGH